MLISNLRAMGNKLYAIRKRLGITQAEAAEKAGISDRSYADIERGTANMRVQTLLQICDGLKITPNDILVDDSDEAVNDSELTKRVISLSTDKKRKLIELINLLF